MKQGYHSGDRELRELGKLQAPVADKSRWQINPRKEKGVGWFLRKPVVAEVASGEIRFLVVASEGGKQGG